MPENEMGNYERLTMNAFQRARNLAYEPEKTLVIIDMQSGFIDCGEESIVPNICSLIRHAKHHKWAIVVVEFNGNGKTIATIHESLVGYPHWTTVQKGDRDGGKEVIDCLETNPGWSMDLLVCGIYGPECVAETVCGLFENSDLVEVAVVLDAVYPGYVPYTEESHATEVLICDVTDCNSPVSS